jgi:diguanylate cyclase (GGDEF)-like protein/PAS domain S-box-containing protein
MQLVAMFFVPLHIFFGSNISLRKSADDQLKTSVQRFVSLSDITPVGICLISQDGSIEHANQKWHDLVHQPKGSITGQSIYSFIHPEDRSGVEKTVFQAMESARPEMFVFRLQRHFDEMEWVQGSFSIINEGIGRKRSLISSWTDISRLKETEEKVRRNEELLTSFLNELPDPAWMKDEEGRYLLVNQAMLDLYKLHRDQFIGKKDAEFRVPEEALVYENTDRDVMESRSSFRFETQLSPDDPDHWYETVKSPVIMDGNVIGTIGISRDISDRRNTAIALTDSEHRLKGLLNNIPDLAWMKDSSRKYLAVNEQFFTRFQTQPQQVVGKPSVDVFSDDIARMLDQDDDEVLVLGRSKIIEALITDPSGYQTWYETIKMPLYDESNHVVGLTGVARDITNRKRSEESIQQRLESEKLISRISTRLNAIDPARVNEEMISILEDIGRQIMADRCLLIDIAENSQEVNRVFQWCVAGVDPHPTDPDVMSLAHFPWVRTKLHELVPFSVTRIVDLPDHARSEIDFSMQEGITSLLAVPVGRSPEQISAVFLAETVIREKRWDDADLQKVKVITEMLTTFLSRLYSEQRVRQAELHYRMLVEQISAVVYIDDANADSTGIYMSPQIMDLIGYTPEEMTGDQMQFWKVVHEEDRERVMKENLRTNQTGDPFQMEYRFRAKNGDIVWVEDRGILFVDEYGKKRWFGVIYNITHRKQIEEALFESEARFHELFDHSPVALWEMDFSRVKTRMDHLRKQGVKDFREYLRTHPREVVNLSNLVEVLDVNQATLQMMRCSVKQELLGSYKVIMQLKPDELFIEQLACLAEGQTRFEVEGANDIVDGEFRYHHVHVLVVPGHETSYERVITAVSDITERKTTEEQLVFLSTHDSLTGLYSRSYFETEMARLQVSRMYPVSILMADADNLKETNDKLGHAAGDKLIIRAAQVLRMTFRPEDVVARIGGDEFAVLIPHTDHETAGHLADRLLNVIRTENGANPDSAELVLSIGIATAEPGDLLVDVLKEADKKMYANKMDHHNHR